MEEGHYHHHHHHHHYNHHGHESQQQANSHVQSSSIERRQQETASRISEQPRYLSQPTLMPVIVPRPPEQTFGGGGGVQATGSFHSVSSIDSSAEMARYFPDPQTPTLSPFRYHQKNGSQQIRTTASNTSINTGPYGPAPVPTAVQPPLRHPVKTPNYVSQHQQPIHASAAPQLPSGVPSYSSQIEGLSVAQAVVNDVIVDLQSKVINETQQQYQNESSNANYFETLSPIYIRAPNPTIILRSDLHRLRAQLHARPQAVTRQVGSINQFQQNTYQVPSFPPPPQQHLPPDCYAEYQNTTHANT